MVELVTPGGYRVSFKDFLDTAGYRAIQRATMAHMQITPGMQASDIAIRADVELDAEEVALTHLLISVVLPDGQPASDPVKAVAAMPYQDGQAVYARVNDLTKEDAGDPKESATSSTS